MSCSDSLVFEHCERSFYPELVTAACGLPPIFFAIYLIVRYREITHRRIHHNLVRLFAILAIACELGTRPSNRLGDEWRHTAGVCLRVGSIVFLVLSYVMWMRKEIDSFCKPMLLSGVKHPRLLKSIVTLIQLLALLACVIIIWNCSITDEGGSELGVLLVKGSYFALIFTTFTPLIVIFLCFGCLVRGHSKNMNKGTKKKMARETSTWKISFPSKSFSRISRRASASMNYEIQTDGVPPAINGASGGGAGGTEAKAKSRRASISTSRNLGVENSVGGQSNSRGSDYLSSNDKGAGAPAAGGRQTPNSSSSRASAAASQASAVSKANASSQRTKRDSLKAVANQIFKAAAFMTILALGSASLVTFSIYNGTGSIFASYYDPCGYWQSACIGILVAVAPMPCLWHTTKQSQPARKGRSSANTSIRSSRGGSRVGSRTVSRSRQSRDSSKSHNRSPKMKTIVLSEIANQRAAAEVSKQKEQQKQQAKQWSMTNYATQQYDPNRSGGGGGPGQLYQSRTMPRPRAHDDQYQGAGGVNNGGLVTRGHQRSATMAASYSPAQAGAHALQVQGGMTPMHAPFAQNGLSPPMGAFRRNSVGAVPEMSTGFLYTPSPLGAMPYDTGTPMVAPMQQQQYATPMSAEEHQQQKQYMTPMNPEQHQLHQQYMAPMNPEQQQQYITPMGAEYQPQQQQQQQQQYSTPMDALNLYDLQQQQQYTAPMRTAPSSVHGMNLHELRQQQQFTTPTKAPPAAVHGQNIQTFQEIQQQQHRRQYSTTMSTASSSVLGHSLIERPQSYTPEPNSPGMAMQPQQRRVHSSARQAFQTLSKAQTLPTQVSPSAQQLPQQLPQQPPQHRHQESYDSAAPGAILLQRTMTTSTQSSMQTTSTAQPQRYASPPPGSTFSQGGDYTSLASGAVPHPQRRRSMFSPDQAQQLGIQLDGAQTNTSPRSATADNLSQAGGQSVPRTPSTDSQHTRATAETQSVNDQ